MVYLAKVVPFAIPNSKIYSTQKNNNLRSILISIASIDKKCKFLSMLATKIEKILKMN